MFKYTIAALLIHSIGFCQITIDENDFADAGDTVIISSVTDLTIDFQTTGPNSVWDFSNLVAESQKFHQYKGLGNAPFTTQLLFGSFAPADYSSNYSHEFSGLPFDQIGGFLPITFENIERYSKITGDSLTHTGYSIDLNGQTVPFRSDTIETAYKFPLNYGDIYSSRGYSTLDLNPIQDAIYIQHRLRQSNVDGHGTITTPYGTFDALRIKHTITESDSLYISVAGFGTWVDLPVPVSHQYEYIAKNEKMPVMKITTQEILGAETVSSIEYKDNYQGLDANLNENSIDISLFPNPSADRITVSTSEGINSYSIFDSEGKMIQQKDISTTKNIEISVSALVTGKYHLILQSENSRSMKSFIVQ